MATERPQIMAYDPAWPDAFAVERDRIAAVLGELAVRIDHHGSTSVPGLAAKPVIDIQVSILRLHPIEAYGAALARLGYVHVPHPDDAFCPYFHRPAVWPHSHHVHAVQAGGTEERRTLAFRDYLRARPHVAREYEALKRRLAATVASKHAYTEAKADFVVRITAQALAEGFPLDQ